MDKENPYWELLMQGYIDSKLEYEKALLADMAFQHYETNNKQTEMRKLKVKEAVVINSKFEERALLEWLEDNQGEVKWRQEAEATQRGFELDFPYILLRSGLECLGHASIEEDISEEGYTIINMDILGVSKEVLEEESPAEAIYRLTQDRAVIETMHNFGNGFSDREVMKLVLDGKRVTDEYYQELREVINKLQCNIQFTVTIKY